MVLPSSFEQAPEIFELLAFNKMLFDMGSGTQLPSLEDPTEKINYLGQQLEDLRSLLKSCLLAALKLKSFFLFSSMLEFALHE